MSSFVDTLSNSVDDIFSVAWDEREGRTVPDSDSVTLRNGAV